MEIIWRAVKIEEHRQTKTDDDDDEKLISVRKRKKREKDVELPQEKKARTRAETESPIIELVPGDISSFSALLQSMLHTAINLSRPSSSPF